MTEPGGNDSRDAFRFPCRLPIKTVGDNRPGFAAEVAAVIHRHAVFDQDTDLTARASTLQRYLAVTVTIEAHSREQLEAIYRDLGALDAVHITL